MSRLFVLDQSSLSCFYESAPHLQEEGKNVLAKISIPFKRTPSQTQSNTQPVLIPQVNSTSNDPQQQATLNGNTPVISRTISLTTATPNRGLLKSSTMTGPTAQAS